MVEEKNMTEGKEKAGKTFAETLHRAVEKGKKLAGRAGKRAD